MEAPGRGDLDTGKAILRDYINATIGFEELELTSTQTPTKSLMRMLGPKGRSPGAEPAGRDRAASAR